MDVTWIELRHVWILAGPVTSALVLRKASLKYHQSNTILRKYESNDVCIFFQFWVHFITNVTFAVLNIPQVEAFVTCTVRKWILLWVASMTFFNNLPSLLDFCMRTNNTPFYQTYHSRSPYNHLLTIVLCTWAPLVSGWIIGKMYPENLSQPSVCDYMESKSIFLYILGRFVLLLCLVVSRIYIIVVTLIKNRNVKDSVIRRHNQILWLRTVIFALCILGFLMENIITEPLQTTEWKKCESRALFFVILGTLSDVIVITFTPPVSQKLDDFFTKVSESINIEPALRA